MTKKPRSERARLSERMGEGIAILLIVSFTAAFVLSSIAVSYGLLRWAFGG